MVLVNMDEQNRLNLIKGIDQPIAGLFYVLKVKLRVDYLNNDHFKKGHNSIINEYLVPKVRNPSAWDQG